MEETSTRIKKVIITAAGSGSRLLPFSKEIPKEMMPIYARSATGCPVLKPSVQVIYESLYNHGCRDFCFVVRRGKMAIEDYFTVDNSTKYASNADLQDFYCKVETSRITYARQAESNGFGAAVLQARMFAEDHIFLLHAGDDLIHSSGNSHIRRLEKAFFSNDADIAFLVERVPDPSSYGVIEGKRIGNGVIRVKHIEEKPNNPKSNLAIIAVYIFKPSIFDYLEDTRLDETGEIQITDAIGSMLEKYRCVAVELNPEESRLDIGTPQRYIKSVNDSFKRSSDPCDA